MTLTHCQRFPCRRLTALLLLSVALLLLCASPPAVVAQDEQDESSSSPCHGRLALVTGATGRVGTMVTKSLHEQGFCLRILSRNATKAKTKFGTVLDDGKMELQVGDLGNEASVAAAFAPRATSGHAAVSHVVFCAGGEEADFDAVNNRGVQYVAQQAVKAGTTSVVVISAAWVSKPYSLASLLFNSLYPSWPMARHMQGEEVLRQVAALSSNMNYVILRAGRLVPDEEYPSHTAAPMGLQYQQGDNFYFWGPAGQPGMCNTQLANAVLTAMQV